MRHFVSEQILKEWARNASQSIVVRTYENGNSRDTRRKPTAHEEEIIFKTIYGALLGLNWGETNRSSGIAEQAILDTAEYTLDLFIPQANGYDTIYNPLRKILTEWEQIPEDIFEK